MACTQRRIQIVFSFLLLLLLISSSTQVRFMAQGRVISNSKPMENAQMTKPMETTTQMDGNDHQDKGSLIVRVNIGSRPPRCERVRCNSCRHCEAVQVPAIPQDKQSIRKQNSRGESGDGQLSKVSTRGDDTTNYKPMSWKCKCGDLIFNP